MADLPAMFDLRGYPGQLENDSSHDESVDFEVAYFFYTNPNHGSWSGYHKQSRPTFRMDMLRYQLYAYIPKKIEKDA